MKVTAIDSSVLASQGGIGSWGMGQPNPAPGVGPASGSDGDLAPAIASPEATAGAKEPTVYTITGPLNEPQSQYSVPVQKG